MTSGETRSVSEFFGLETERDTDTASAQVISYNLSFFRFVCGRLRLVQLLALNALLVVGTCAIVAKYDSIKACNKDLEAQNYGAMDWDTSSCTLSYFSNGFHVMHVLACIFFSLIVLNGQRYGTKPEVYPMPKSVFVQWTLFSILLPLSITALAGFEILSHGKGAKMTVYPSMRAANWTSAIFFCIFGFGGFYEMNYRHILLSTCALATHFFVTSALSFSGVQVYPNFFYKFHSLPHVAFSLLLIHITVHLFWVVFQRYKIRAMIDSVWIKRDDVTGASNTIFGLRTDPEQLAGKDAVPMQRDAQASEVHVVGM